MANRSRRLSRGAARALLAAASLAAALVVAELLVRAADPFGISYYRDNVRYLAEAVDLVPQAELEDSRIFQHRPSLDVRFATFRFFTDDLGLRVSGPGVVTERRSPGTPAERMRILFLGDSVTLAWGVDDEATWIRALERSTRAADGRPIECLNAGHLRYNTQQEADLFAACGPLLAPEVVVLTFVTNDVFDDPHADYRAMVDAATAAAAGAGPGPLQRLADSVTGHFRGVRGLLRLREHLAIEQLHFSRTYAAADNPNYAVGLARSLAALDRIRAQCELLGARLVVLDHGDPRVFPIRTWCEGAGVPWYDVTFTDAEWALGIRNSRADAHANARGNALLFEKARAGLADAGVLARAANQ